ncbi:MULTISPECIES: hypothetical protein [unclassified Enterococcus]|uniref:hypothetical protein n=1 Tax=unclassified Enterococcus TaxID=2608891 RepID=UPI003D2AE580
MKMIKLGLSLILVFSMLLQIIQLITNLRLFKKYAGVKKIDVLMNPSILKWLKENDISFHR